MPDFKQIWVGTQILFFFRPPPTPIDNGKEKIASTKPGSNERILKLANENTAAGQKFCITGGFVTSSKQGRLESESFEGTFEKIAAAFAKKKGAAEALVAKCGGEFARLLAVQHLKVIYDWKFGGKKVAAGMKKEQIVAALVIAKDDAPVGAVKWSEEVDGADLERLEKAEITMKETLLGKATMAEKFLEKKCVQAIKEVTPEMMLEIADLDAGKGLGTNARFGA
eukprot:jgi/Psemu1/9848/gm1.9848_g